MLLSDRNLSDSYLFLLPTARLAVEDALYTMHLDREIVMSQRKQSRTSKIHIEVKDIRPYSIRRNSMLQLNTDADGGDLNTDADGGDLTT